MPRPSARATLKSAMRPASAENRARQWEALARRLELAAAPDSEQLLRSLLNVEDRKAEFGPIYRAELDFETSGRARLYLLDYALPADAGAGRSEAQTVSVCLLNFKEAFSTVSLKASRKLHAVLESIQASASGSVSVKFDNDTDFSDAVTVLARDPDLARSVLTERPRRLLQRALYERGCEPVFVLGERQLMFSVAAPADTPTDLEQLEDLALDLISFYTATEA